MWLTSIVAKNNKQRRSGLAGCVTDAKGASVEFFESSRHKDVPLVAPFGVVSIPPVGSEAVALRTSSGVACVGVKNKPSPELEPGELMLCSLGASIVLKNDGRVLINGKEFGG